MEVPTRRSSLTAVSSKAAGTGRQQEWLVLDSVGSAGRPRLLDPCRSSATADLDRLGLIGRLRRRAAHYDDRVRIEIAEPALVVLVGPAGGGKTTFAARHFAPEEVVSSDAIRAQLTGSEADQSRNSVVFRVLNDEVAGRLRGGGIAVVDATNVERHARRVLLRLAAAADVPAVAIVFDLPLAEVLARNAARPGRAVPEEVVTRHWQALVRSLHDGSLDREGFAAVHVLGDPVAIDEAAVSVRRPSRRR
jgi:predicted kinase